MAEANIGLEDDRVIVLRIGIELGDVAVEGDDLYGEGVNIAARLEGAAEPGTICISGTVYDQVKGKLKLDYHDLGRKLLKNISEPVQVYLIRSDAAAGDEGRSSARVLPLPPKPSIAVLPFDNLSGGPDQQYFSDGISEDLITELSRFRSLFVIARNSSFRYRGKAVDIRQVGRELGVQYVLEGSVQRGGSRIRITAQLIDALSGNHLWAERYDRDLNDVFAVQDEVVQTIVATLFNRLEAEELELARRRPPQDIRAYDLWLRGRKLLDLRTPGANSEARDVFEQALAIDASYGRAYAGLAATYANAAWYSGWARGNEDNWSCAFKNARRAISFDETDPIPHVELAWLHHHRREYDRARHHIERAVALNPNDADVLADRAALLFLGGEPEAGVRCAETAIRLNPSQPYYYLNVLSSCHFYSRNFVEALRVREMALAAAPEHGQPEARATLAAIHAHLGNVEKAKECLRRFLSEYEMHWKEPLTATSWARRSYLRRDADRQLLIDGLVKAGLPE
jgi:adenylate cyclase